MKTWHVYPMMVVFPLLISSTAQAQDAKAEARALYEQADKEMEANDFAQACPHFEAAKRLLPEHINTGIRLAACYDGLGRTASALAECMRVKAVAVAQKKEDKEKIIDDAMAKLLPRVPEMRLDVRADVAAIAGLVIRRNGAVLESAQWGVLLPVDPGTYHIEVSAPGRKTWTIEKEIAPKTTPEAPPVVVVVEAPVVEAPVVEAPVVEQQAAEVKKQAPAKAVVAQDSGVRTVGLVGVIGGTAITSVGLVFGGLAIARNAESNDRHCQANDHCDQVGFDLRKDAQSFGNISSVVVAVGAGMLGVGVVSFVVAKGAPEGKEAMRVVMGPGGIAVRGEF